MRFKANAMMRSNPDFELDALLEPLTFAFDARGSFHGTIGEIRAEIGRIPIDVAIPFLKRRHLVRIASVGGFHVRLHPMHLNIEHAAVQATGTLGTKGLQAKLRGKVGCQTEMGVTGTATGDLGAVKISMGSDDDEHEHHEHDEHHEHHEHGEHHEHHEHDEHDEHHEHGEHHEHQPEQRHRGK